MHSTKSFFIILVVFATVAAIGGYFTGKITVEPTIIEAPTVIPTQPSVKNTPVANTEMLALNRLRTENERLRNQLAELERSIARDEAELLEAEDVVAMQEVPPMVTPPEQLSEQEQAERHERMMQNLRNRQQHMQEMRQQRIDFLSNIDISLLTPEEQATHQSYIQAVKRHAEMEAAMFERNMNDIPATEEDFMAMRESAMAVLQLQEQERTALLNAVGTMWNVPEENLGAFVNMVEEVNAVLGGGRGGMMMGGPMIFNGPGPGRRGGGR